jgi:hypothetical protein
MSSEATSRGGRMDTPAKAGRVGAFELVHGVESELGSRRNLRAEGCPVSVSVTKHKNLVGGEWVDAASGETMEVLNPSTGEVIAEVPRSSADDVERAVEAARKAYS